MLPGVTVEASSPALIEKVRAAQTDTEGRYQITELRPGTYVVTFALEGFTSVRCEGIELNTGFPRERAHVTVRPEGTVDVVLGTLSLGQGHATSFGQLVVEWLGVELSQVNLVTGDTDVTVVGGGAHSARALRLAAIVMAKASDEIVEKGRRVAAWLLEAAPADVEFRARRFRVKGTDRSVDLFATAAAALRPDAPADCRGPLDGTSDETMPQPSFPYGAAVCEVEVVLRLRSRFEPMMWIRGLAPDFRPKLPQAVANGQGLTVSSTGHDRIAE